MGLRDKWNQDDPALLILLLAVVTFSAVFIAAVFG